MSNAIDDKELDDYLSGGTQYSRRYRAIAADAVPSELDSLVLGNAKANNVVAIDVAADKCAGVAQRSKSLGFWMRMSVPVALAASFVFAISIMMESGLRHDSAPLRKTETQSVPTTPAVTSFVEPEANRLPQTAAIQVPAAMETKQTSEQDKLERVMPPERRPTSSAISPSTDLNNGVVSGQLVRGPAAEATTVIDTRAREEVARPNTPTPTLPTVAPTAVAAAPASASIDPAAAAKVKAAPSTATESRSNAQRSTGAAGLEEIIVTAQKRRDSSAGAGPRNSIPSTSFSEREPSDAEIAQERRESNPVTWLAFIRELRASNKIRAADREWKNFVKAYPQYAVDAADTARPKR